MSADMDKVIKNFIEHALMGDREYQKLCFDHYSKGKQEQPQRCTDFKRLVLSALKHTDWIVNDVQFDDDNVGSINIKFTSEFSLGNSPWDPR